MKPFNPFGAFLLEQLRALNNGVFSISIRNRTQAGRATNQNVIVGNTGAVSTGQQSAGTVNA
jgi:hypothetical protein